MSENPIDLVSVRSLVKDVTEAVDFYTSHFDYTVRNCADPTQLADFYLQLLGGRLL